MSAGRHTEGVGHSFGIAPRDPDPVVVGRKAYVQWWERVRAAVALVVLVVLLGLATAAAVGALFFVGGFVLEQIVG
ncbi:MAG: hypothetical protein MUE34_05550 [Acidimicrobiales bacterium]|jgi:hypothetical protein|nr:hypothetical protein [Acidimicrobiales bacterium]